MRSKIVIPWLTVFLLLVGLNGSASSQPPHFATIIGDDTCDIAIEYTTAYPGRGIWMTVWMKNPVSVTGYRFLLELSSDVARFFCDTSGYNCFIDTTGCSSSILPIIGCECQGTGAKVLTYALADTEAIPPNPDYLCLFKIRMDFCCIPDADTNRSAFIYMDRGVSILYDLLSNPLPFRYHIGELFVWWSVPGDVTGDSLVNVSDVIFLIHYLYIKGPVPCVCEAADCNNDGAINSADVSYLINYLFINGPAPARGRVSCRHEDCWR